MLEKFKNFGYVSFVATLVLVAFGTVAIYSAGHARDPIFHGMWKANLATAAFAFAIYFAAAFFDYRAILKWLSVPAYAASVVFLVAVLFLGSEIYGGRRWLWFFQPSEVAKLSAIMLFAWMLGRGGSRGRAEYQPGQPGTGNPPGLPGGRRTGGAGAEPLFHGLFLPGGPGPAGEPLQPAAGIWRGTETGDP